MGLEVSIIASTDNKSLVEAVHCTKNPQDKRLRVEINSLRSMIENREVNRSEWRNTSAQLAEFLTKSNGSAAEKLLKHTHVDYMTWAHHNASFLNDKTT